MVIKFQGGLVQPYLHVCFLLLPSHHFQSCRTLLWFYRPDIIILHFPDLAIQNKLICLPQPSSRNHKQHLGAEFSPDALQHSKCRKSSQITAPWTLGFVGGGRRIRSQQVTSLVSVEKQHWCLVASLLQLNERQYLHGSKDFPGTEETYPFEKGSLTKCPPHTHCQARSVNARQARERRGSNSAGRAGGGQSRRQRAAE